MSLDARRRFLYATGGLLAASSGLLAQAQSSKRIARIGWLGIYGGTSNTAMDALRSGLRELGYVEGRDFILEFSQSAKSFEQLPDVAKVLVTQGVDVIIVSSIREVLAARSATTAIPIVCAACGNLVDSGLVDSLARPGGNLTGLSNTFSETASKLMQLAKEIAPQAKSAAVIWGGPSNAFWVRQKLELEKAASQLRVSWHAPQNSSELASSFDAIAKLRPELLVILSTGFTYVSRKDIVKFALQTRLPAVYDFRQYVDDGGLISYGADVLDSFRRSAGYVDKILKGAKPGDLAIELPSKFELVVNLRTANALGIKIPQPVLIRADRVIE